MKGKGGQRPVKSKLLRVDLQDPHTKYPQNTSVTETKDYLYIGSLSAPVLARLNKAKAGMK